MDIQEIVFVLTDRCNASCDVCCFQCSPKRSFLMDESVMRRYIDEASQLGTVERIGFSGGEALLYPDLLKRTMRYAKETHGFQSTLVSNGFWAADYQKGLALMKELKDCGLNGIRLSTDCFHQKYVSPKTFRNALRILHETGLLDDVSIMDTVGGTNISTVIENLRPEIYLVPSIMWYPVFLCETTCSNPDLGLEEKDIPRPCAWDKCSCVDVTGVVMHIDGYIYNCCSPYSFDIPKMRLGKIGETTLEEVRRQRSDPFLDLIRRDSVSWFAKKAKELDPEFHFKETYSNSCELCKDILCNEELVHKLEPYVKQEVWKLKLNKIMKRDKKDE